jgi:hypothetical protein
MIPPGVRWHLLELDRTLRNGVRVTGWYHGAVAIRSPSTVSHVVRQTSCPHSPQLSANSTAIQVLPQSGHSHDSPGSRDSRFGRPVQRWRVIASSRVLHPLGAVISQRLPRGDLHSGQNGSGRS